MAWSPPDTPAAPAGALRRPVAAVRRAAAGAAALPPAEPVSEPGPEAVSEPGAVTSACAVTSVWATGERSTPSVRLPVP